MAINLTEAVEAIAAERPPGGVNNMESLQEMAIDPDEFMQVVDAYTEIAEEGYGIALRVPHKWALRSVALAFLDMGIRIGASRTVEELEA